MSRTVSGLVGIFLSPFLHGSLLRLISNSIIFTVFAIVLAFLEGHKLFSKVIVNGRRLVED